MLLQFFAGRASPSLALCRRSMVVRAGEPSKFMQYAARPPKKDVPSWKNLAATLKDEQSDSPYLARIRRDVVDMKDHVERIEEEVLEEMSAALGRTATRCDYKFFMLDKAKEKVDAAAHRSQRRAAIEAFNAARLEAEEARRALLIHRQAIGFRTQNYQEVSKFWPLPKKMEEEEEGSTSAAEGDGEAAGKAGSGKMGEFRRGKGGVHLTHEGQLSWADQMPRLYSRRG